MNYCFVYLTFFVSISSEEVTISLRGYSRNALLVIIFKVEFLSAKVTNTGEINESGCKLKQRQKNNAKSYRSHFPYMETEMDFTQTRWSSR